ncbi:ShlB/FhaC/HecB family hemolysin secretion/activation protein [Leptolyngbya sp. FACHB-261]|uniref:ShlB/FhaC/HecB family hemolysin secretion/activation protein n=1 Tax=Leptolyngbya sp. FACHB-261 TaxID=2692806 RepID=UPI001686B4DD|nr:ShlB/FhaC/HecB family hemolysin secretion/activation protein [Leptolyngbya sp. FACHB-261]MBD2100199.1 ShlB/FhaC/HecB family hemolysin secretion/activation protein [Leptolyngbya sp. FACHB-261]
MHCPRACSLARSWLLISVGALAGSLLSEPAYAQRPPQLDLPQPQERPRQFNLPRPQDVFPAPAPALPEPPPPEPLPPPAELLPLQPGAPELSEPPSGPVPERIVVREIRVVGSTVFSAEQLAAITAPFTNRPIAFSELLQARSAITQFYIDQGYITSGAYIPAEQMIRDGVVTIQVIEGSVESITVSGTTRLNPNYVRSRLALAAKAPLNRNRLLEALQVLQLDPLIANLSAELSASTRPGNNLLEVRVSEADSFNTQFGVDNGRSPSVGTLRGRVQFDEGNLLGLGDRISAAYTLTEGSDAVDVSYTLPLSPRNTTFSLRYSHGDNDVIEEPFNALGIISRFDVYEFSLRHPILQTPTEEVALGITASRQETATEVSLNDIGPFPISPGADEKGRTRVSALRFFQEWTQRSSRYVLAFRSQFSLGLDVLDATIRPDPPDSRFFSWRGQGQWVRLLAPDTLLLLRGDLQFAGRTLVPLEQFGLGGQDSVRGYRQDELLTDNGLFASAEVRLPVLRVPEIEGLLQVAPFVDVGTGWNLSGQPNPEQQTLVSVGLGLRWQMGDRLTARFDWGIPLISVDSPNRTLQEQGLYFSLNWSPF